jgi:hypothetical protein
MIRPKQSGLRAFTRAEDHMSEGAGHRWGETVLALAAVQDVGGDLRFETGTMGGVWRPPPPLASVGRIVVTSTTITSWPLNLNSPPSVGGIDIEGSSLANLNGASATLQPPTALVTIRNNANPPDVAGLRVRQCDRRRQPGPRHGRDVPVKRQGRFCPRPAEGCLEGLYGRANPARLRCRRQPIDSVPSARL